MANPYPDELRTILVDLEDDADALQRITNALEGSDPQAVFLLSWAVQRHTRTALPERLIRELEDAPDHELLDLITGLFVFGTLVGREHCQRQGHRSR